jgi:hypothetical protein
MAADFIVCARAWLIIAIVTLSPGGDAAALYWQARARRLQLTLRAGRLVQSASPLLLAVAIPGALLLLLARRQGVPLTRALGVVAASLLITLAVTVWRQRREAPTRSHALACLDARLSLHNRLVSAAAGVGGWPPVPRQEPRVVRWNLTRAATPGLFAAALLCAAAAVPVKRARAASPAAPPPALAEAQSLLQELAEEKLADDKALREWQQRLDEMKARPSHEWYEHDTLEAADTLHERLDSDIRELARDLDNAAASLDSPGAQGAGQKPAATKALQDLESSALKAPRELRDALRQAGAQGAHTLTPQEMRSLREKLSKTAGACRMVTGPCPPGSPDCILSVGRDGKPSPGGAPSRGPGTAALTIGPDPTAAQPGRREGVSSRDLREAVPGDLVGMDWGAPVTEDSKSALAPGGRAAAGQGGEAVWRQVFSPEERRVLGRYFK